MKNNKITFEQLNDQAFRRAQLISEKSGATWVAFQELNGLINKTQLAGQYFQRTQAWLSQKLNGCEVCKKKAAFTEAEYHELAEAFRDIARRLEVHAAEIDAAVMDQE